MRKWVLFSMALCSPLVGAEVWLRSEAQAHIGRAPERARRWGIVLGAPAQDGRLSDVLAARLDAAAALWRAGLVRQLLITGDDGRFATDEVTVMRTGLLARGVDEGALVVDGGAPRTLASMVRARALFDVEDAVVVTNAFHLPRAVYLARRCGIDAFGVEAEDRAGWVKRTGWWVRERAAVVRAVYDTSRAPDALD